MSNFFQPYPDPDLAKRRNAWRAHLPTRCRLLFIGEAPPPEERYFYYPESPRHDHLFIELIQVLYPGLRTRGVQHIRVRKPQLLRRFTEDGYLLIDAIEGRIPLLGRTSRVQAVSSSQADLLARITEIGHNDFTAIPLKTTVQDGLSPETKSRIGVLFVNDRIPFPSSGQQAKFRRQLDFVLRQLPSRRTDY